MNYYFDIETSGFNPKEHKLLTVQYQEIDYRGNPKGDLIILKEWKIGEEKLVKSIYERLMDENVWHFVPILTNHIFDFTFLFEKFKKYKLKCPSLSEWLYTKPFVDIKYTLIMVNGLNFKGSGLDQVTNKKMNGRLVPEWYKNKEYHKIEEYIKDETECFIEFFQESIKSLKQVRYSLEDKEDEDVTGDEYYNK